ncbi:hypothetical protein EVAR_43498_1 [Eumeta japonica]|uniref:Uncharacterized protein n=1 Tax=Eumeta variegata TaxID=151549 RepID=A0A4C1YL48_EUMVA|nr:hypothetical protein EVAR_43498_1 [Eumeta japonica]
MRCTEQHETHKRKQSRRATGGVEGAAAGGGPRCARTPTPRSPAARHGRHARPLGPRLIKPRRAAPPPPLPFSSCSCQLFATATLPPA